MKILHTGDWHLGKRLFKISRLPEQQLFLKWLENEIIQKDIEVLVISGDIFDTPSPQADATRLFFDFLHQISSNTKCHILVIAGNHDSGAYIEAPKQLLQDKKISLCGKIKGNDLDQISIGPATFTMLPFFRAYEVLSMANQLEIETETEEEKILKTLETLFSRACKNKEQKHFLIAHHLFGNMDQIEMGGSEQVITLSGLPSIPLSILDGHFDYLALGHIHKKHTVKTSSPMIRYPGAPMAFRFSENEKKSYTLIELDQNSFNTSEVIIPSFRKIICVRCEIEELETEIKKINGLECDDSLPALLEVQVSVKSPESGIADRIRAEISGKNIELLSLKVQVSGEQQNDFLDEVMTALPSLEELFKMFYHQRHPDAKSIPEEIEKSFKQLLSELTQSSTEGQ